MLAAQRTVVMVIDVSLSMGATDVEPTRLAAAQAAAKRFIRSQPRDVKIGIVSFAATADIVQSPTANRDIVPPGSYHSGAIVLLTDGSRTMGPDPAAALALAAAGLSMLWCRRLS